MAGPVTQFQVWVQEIINSFGYVGVALMMFVENVFPPIPSEVVMPFAGFLVTRGTFSFVGIVIAGTVGSIIGALPIYYLGVRLTKRRVRRLIRRHGHWFLVDETDFERANRLFHEYGWVMILVGRLVPGVRSVISLPAGLDRMPLVPFLAFTALGTGLWSALLAYAGIALGDNWQRILAVLDQYQTVLLVIVVFCIMIFAIRRAQQRYM